MSKAEISSGGEDHSRSSLPLFEIKEISKAYKLAYRLFAVSIFVGICLIWVYRIIHIPIRSSSSSSSSEDPEGAYSGPRRWIWFALLAAEVWFGHYWVITQSVRWNNIYRYTFKDRLSLRYGENLPAVDIYVCTADPTIEPPTLVINTVLSVIAYDYPPDKLSVYLSDDGGSDLTFYALLEASRFAKYWIPFCKKFKVEPRSPAAYFAQNSNPPVSINDDKDWVATKIIDGGVTVMKQRFKSLTSTAGPTTLDDKSGAMRWM